MNGNKKNNGEDVIGKLISIYIQDKKGGPREKLSKGVLEKDKGLLGDYYAQGGSRQISLLSKETRGKIMSLETKGLCTERFHENLAIEDLNLEKLKVGSQILIGRTIQEVTQVGKRCFPECKIIQEGKICPLSTDVIFTKVLQGGPIKIGNIIIRIL